jgi:hypothetical protein
MSELDKLQPLERIVLLLDLIKKFPSDIELLLDAYERGEVDKDTFVKIVSGVMSMAMELQVKFGKLVAKRLIGEMVE